MILKPNAKQTCVECHFLAVSHQYSPASGKNRHEKLSEEQRDNLRKGISLHGNIALACDWGEWGEHDPETSVFIGNINLVLG